METLKIMLIKIQKDEDFIQYDRKLKETINRPYDQSEYEELLKNKTEQKFTSKLKVLRRRTISYTIEKKRKALLDYHPDLAAKIETVDCHSGLILLRGFFFWIQVWALEHTHIDEPGRVDGYLPYQRWVDY
ncbi:hypothetical protein ZOSMA_463G00050 [Zostera marina]|uniref:Uncharacterized protein n=1 Tax=Zostera marina TaxID=29655 RepID=A0A0K9P046_ZOSMR|nr:hypothetical protein ZOSMA_463G00050 [Zostera marina]